jgi:heme iron utilization protein
VDPDGLDIALGDVVARLPFSERVINGHALRKTMAGLAAKARAQA